MKNERDATMLSCDDTRSLVPGYLDGELSEEQAAPLRTHLFECPVCREVTKQGKTLRRWFEAGPHVVGAAVPEGFASRVARRAFAGDPGLPAAVDPGPLRDSSRSASRTGSLLPFLLTLSAVAAGLLFTFAIALQRQTLPRENGLDALTPPDWAKPEGLRDTAGEASPVYLPTAAPATGDAEEDEPPAESDESR